MFKGSHTKKDFVPKVDFITCSGFSAHLNDRQRPGGPEKIIATLATIKVDRKQKKFVLESVHPGVTPKKVIENTGFQIEVPLSVPETDSPTVDQLKLLRTVVRKRLEQINPQYSQGWEDSIRELNKEDFRHDN